MAFRPAGAAATDRPYELSELDHLRALAARVGARCVVTRSTVAAAESCTGGLVLHALTEVPGSSAYVEGGVVTYSDRLKRELLGVSKKALDQHGAVSAEVAIAMALGARDRLGTTHAVAVTGIAGPAGGTAEKPVGLTFVAVTDADGHDVRRFEWHGGRSANKRDSARAALQMLLERLGEEA